MPLMQFALSPSIRSRRAGSGRSAEAMRLERERQLLAKIHTLQETNAGLQTQSGFLRFFPLTEATGKVPAGLFARSNPKTP